MLEQLHGHRIVRPQPCQRTGRCARGGAVHGPEHRHFGHVSFDAEGVGNRCVQVVLVGCADKTDIARHGSKHSWLDLAEIGPNQRRTRLGSHEGPHHRRQVVETGRRRHPARRTVRPGPLAAESARTDMLVQPTPPVGGGDAFGPAPGEECVDQRLIRTQGFHPPCPGVGEVEPLATEHGLDLRRIPKVDLPTRFEVCRRTRSSRSARRASSSAMLDGRSPAASVMSRRASASSTGRPCAVISAHSNSAADSDRAVAIARSGSVRRARRRSCTCIASRARAAHAASRSGVSRNPPSTHSGRR